MSKSKIQLSDHFTYGRLLRFTMPSIFMMIFTSIYGTVDGFFISNFAGKTAFAALNLIFPDFKRLRRHAGRGRQCACCKNARRGQY